MPACSPVRRLSPEERALWRRVTAGIRPAMVRDEDSVPEPAASTPARPSAASLKEGMAAKRNPAGIGATLDKRWDRQLREGQVMPDRVVDLHGLNAEQAHRRALSAVAHAVQSGERVVVLVTGRPPSPGVSRLDQPLRGIIRASIGDWLAASSMARSIAAIRPAHPRHGGAGAIYIILRRQPH